MRQAIEEPLSGARSNAESTGFCVGAGRTLISPQQPIALSGRINRDAPYRSIASDLEANVIILSAARGVVVLVGIDLLFASQELRRAVLDSLDPALQNTICDIVFIASHTHNAPSVDRSKPLLGSVDPAYLSHVASQIAGLITQVLASPARPATALWRGQSVCGLNASRRRRGLRLRLRPLSLKSETNAVVGKLLPDLHALHVLIAKDAEGRVLWAMWQWTCHAIGSPDETAVSADFPGVVRDFLRRELGNENLAVVFLPGFCGDVRPDAALLPIAAAAVIAHPFQRPFARPTPRSFAALTQALKKSTAAALQQLVAVNVADELTFSKVAVPLAKLLAEAYSETADMALEVLVFDGGDFGLLLLSAETTSHYVGVCRDLVKPGWLMSGYCNQVFGYLPGDKEIAEGGYEAEGFFYAFSLKGRFARAIEQHVLSAIKSLTARP